MLSLSLPWAAGLLGGVMGLVMSFGIHFGIRGLLENAALGEDANTRKYYIYGGVLAAQLLVPVGLMIWKRDLVRSEPLALVLGLMVGMGLGLLVSQAQKK
jgi:hypothetical protein